MKSNFTYKIEGNILFIEDLNLGGKSVTNDIENVIESIGNELRPTDISINDLKVMYRDSDGTIDGIKTKSGSFEGFYFIGETEYEKAKLKVK